MAAVCIVASEESGLEDMVVLVVVVHIPSEFEIVYGQAVVAVNN